MENITDIFLASIGTALLAYEVVVWGMAYFINKKFKSALLSPRITIACKAYPIIPLSIGALLGHWLW